MVIISTAATTSFPSTNIKNYSTNFGLETPRNLQSHLNNNFKGLNITNNLRQRSLKDSAFNIVNSKEYGLLILKPKKTLEDIKFQRNRQILENFCNSEKNLNELKEGKKAKEILETLRNSKKYSDIILEEKPINHKVLWRSSVNNVAYNPRFGLNSSTLIIGRCFRNCSIDSLVNFSLILKFCIKFLFFIGNKQFLLKFFFIKYV